MQLKHISANFLIHSFLKRIPKFLQSLDILNLFDFGPKIAYKFLLSTKRSNFV